MTATRRRLMTLRQRPVSLFGLAAALCLAGCGPVAAPQAAATATADVNGHPVTAAEATAGAGIVLTGGLAEQGPDYLMIGTRRVRTDGSTRYLTPLVLGTEGEVVARQDPDGGLTAISVRVVGPEGTAAPED